MSFLSALAAKPREIVSYDQLRESVWFTEKEMSESLRRLIQTMKGDLVKTLRRIGIRIDLLNRLKAKVIVSTLK